MDDAYRSQFWNSMQAQSLPQPPKQKKTLPKWLIMAIIGVGVLVIIIVIIVLVIPGGIGGGSVNDGDKLDDKTYEADLNGREDAMSIKDELSPAYAAEAEKDAHYKYETENDATVMVSLKQYDVCLALNVDCSELANPDKVESLRQITALNTNSMTYYLDQGHVLVMVGYGDYPFSLVGQPIVIFGAHYGYGVKFMTFSADRDGKISSINEFGRDMLVNKVVGVPKFYISKEVFKDGSE
jgi:hypothetical protein